MKVYISLEMEGVAGISHPAPTNRGDVEYRTLSHWVPASTTSGRTSSTVASCRPAPGGRPDRAR